MPERVKKRERQKPKLGDSLSLAYGIVVGSLRLLARYPKLVVPMVPVFILVELLCLAANAADTSLRVLGLFPMLYGVALALMISFGVVSRMVKQIHEGHEPALKDAALSTDLIWMIPSIAGLTAIWFSVVLVLVIIEMIIRAILRHTLGRFYKGIGEAIGDAVMNAIFRTIADALRMAAFMMVAIMTFENVGVHQAYDRLRQITKRQAVAACGGLVLTSLVSLLVGLLLLGVQWFVRSLELGAFSTVVWVAILSPGWLLSIYLEQMFVTGLYLYCTAPDSPVVSTLLQNVIGRELPEPARAS